MPGDVRRVGSPVLVLILAALLPVVACGGDGEVGDTASETAGTPAAQAGSPRVVEISGRDFAYDAPAELPAGWTTFRFVNEGEEPHHVTIVRLADGVSAGDIVETYGAGEPMVDGVTALGGPNAVVGPTVATTTVELTPGRYAIVCFIPSPDGIPHLSKGMIQELLVTEATAETAAPAAEMELEMMDYAFRQSSALEAGRRTIRVTNIADDHIHEVALARLAEGTTADDMVAWIQAYEAGEAAGPPPGEFLGGVSALGPGEENYMTVDLEPGRYVWLCPLTEEMGQPSHLEHGMYMSFQVG